MSYVSEVLADSPLVYYRLNETSGTAMSDSSGNGVHGTYSGATLGQTALHAGNTAAALGGASGQGIGSASAASFGTDESFSVEFWVKYNNTNDPKGIVSRWAGGHGWIIWQRQGYLKFTVLNSGGQQDLFLAATLITPGATKHVVIVQNGTAWSIYLNKVEVASGTLSGTYTSASMTSTMQIGGYNGSNYSQATVSDVAYYSTPLSAARIAAHYDAASSGGGGITGAVAATLPALSASAAGTVTAPTFTGAVAATLPALTASITGTHTSSDATGTVAATLPALTASITGDTRTDGTLTATLPALTAAIAGDVPVAGQVAATLPALTASIADSAGDVTGTVTATLPALTAAVVGDVPTVRGLPWTADQSGITALLITTSSSCDYTPPLDLPPAGVVERPLMRRSVIVPRLSTIPGVITDPETGKLRIPDHIYDALPVIEEELGTFHVIFPDNAVSHDVTYYNGGRTQIVSYRQEEPFGDATAQIEIPAIDTHAALPPFVVNGANVEIVIKRPDGTSIRRWAGHAVSHDAGNDQRTTQRRISFVGSMFQAATDCHRPPTFQDPYDIGYLIPRSLNMVTSHRYSALSNVATGIMSRQRGAWSDNPLSYAQSLLATAWTFDGRQWTIAKVEGTRRTYEMRLKKTLPQWTFTNGARGVEVNLTSDATPTINVVYGHGVGPDGYAWWNYHYPGLHPDDSPAYPYASASTVMTVGSTDAGTLTGEGVTVWQRRARDLGYKVALDGVYNASDADITRTIQRRYGAAEDGAVGPQTWNAMFAVGSNVGDLSDPRRLPLAADPRTQKWLYNADGSVKGENPDYDVNIIVHAVDLDLGTGITRAQGIKSAQQIIDRESTPGLSGSITVYTDPREGSRWLIPPGDKLTLIGYEGRDVVMHIAAVTASPQSGSVTFEVDEKSRDAMTLAQILTRNREARRDPARRPGSPNKRSRLEVDQVVPFDGESPAGWIPRMPLYGGLWSVVRIPVSELGKVAMLDITTKGPATKFAMALFGAPITPAHLVKYVGNPLADKSGWTKNRELLEDRFGWLEGVGSPDQPAGYWPGLASDGDPVTGRLKDTGGFEYVSARPSWLWVAFWSPMSTFVSGRILPAVVV